MYGALEGQSVSGRGVRTFESRSDRTARPRDRRSPAAEHEVIHMKRRKFLIGIGATATSGGAVMGSGAFSQTEADRSINVDIGTDSTAYMQFLTAAEEGSSAVFNQSTDNHWDNQSFVTTDSSGLIQFNFTSSQGTADGQGLNDNAVTSFDNLFVINNESNQKVTLDYSAADASNSSTDWTSAIDLVVGSNGNRTADTDISGITLTNDGSANEEIMVKLKIDTNTVSGNVTLTLTAKEA